MELAIMGIVGLMGYTLSEKETKAADGTAQPPPRHAQAYPWGPGSEVQRLLAEDRAVTQARWEQSMQPQLTGVVAPNSKPAQQPFFSSAKKQHTNNAVKQRLMETFTGATDLRTSQTGTYASKKEVPALFAPEWGAGAVSSSGATRAQAFGADQNGRYIPSQKQNNVVPTQRIQVGPGLGVGTEVSAADGFHPMLRVMPKNVNEHRLNNLPGGVVSGASAIAGQPVGVTLAQQGPPRFWEQERRPTAATKAAVNAASERPAQLLAPCGGRMAGEDYFGTGGRVGSYVGAAGATRDRDDNNLAVHETNVTGARHGVGAFAKATHDTARIDSQRREQAQQYEGMLTGHAGPTANELYVLPQTNRSLLTTDVAGNPASRVEGGRARPGDAAGRTLREMTHPQTQPGVAAPYIKGHSVQATDKWLDRESKRYGQHMVGWVPPPLMATDVRLPGLVQLKPRLQLPEAPPLPTVPTPAGMAPAGQSTTTYNKLPVTNNRLDLTIAKNQLTSNPLHVPMVR